MKSKKLVSVVLTASTLVWGLGIATLPLANAQTSTDIQSQINALLAEIQQLQSQLATAQGGSSSSSVSCSFTRDLTVGSTGSDVKCLQQFLNANGAQVAASGAGSPGNESTYFGSLTKAAVAKYQAANGIKPAAGYFGPMTRAYVASHNVGSSTGTTGTTGSTGSTTGTTVPATGLSVSLSSSNPSAGSLISSTGSAAARVPVLAINLTASNSGAVTVTDLKLHKTGVLSDSSISGAYLTQNGQVLYQYTSLNQGVIDFSSMNLSVPAGQTVTLVLAIDPSTGLAAGNTVSFSMNSASDVMAVDSNNTAVTASGSFPLNGNIFTVTSVSNPNLATLAITSSSIGTQVTAGTQNNIVGAWTFAGSNSLTYLKGIKFTVIGSANNADLRNVKLSINGTQVGNTLATVASNGTAYFDLSSSPATLNTGNNNVQIYADVMGSPSKNFQFEILNSYDVLAVDSQYNVPIAVTLTSGADAQVTIAQGTITVTQDASTPTGNVAVGQSGVTLAKFDIYAAGEPVKVKFLDFELDFTGTTSTLSDMVKNVSLVDDAGGQVGSTIGTPPSSNVCSTNGTAALTGSNYKDCFGTASSPINYIVPANTTRVLSLKADIPSTALWTTVTGKLDSDTSNLQGLTSSQTNSSAGASGSALTLQSSLLTVTKNSAYGDQTVQPGSSNVKIGSYTFAASSASGIQINTVSVKAYPAGTNGSNDYANLKLMVNGSQFGTTQGVVSDGSTYSFSGSPITIAAGGTTNVDVYADVLSNSTASSTATQLTGCSGTGTISYNSVSCPTTAISGQNVTASTAGATVNVGLDSSAPAASQLVMGSTGNTLAAFRFTETTNVANVNITDLTVMQTSTASASPYANLTLYNGSTALATGGSASSTGSGFTYKFHFATSPVVPQNGTLVLTLKGDVASYNSVGSTADNTTSTFGIASASDITALTVGSNKAATISGAPVTGNTMTVLRTTLTPSFAALGNSTSRVKSSVDNLATVTLSANNAGSATLGSIALTFSGNAINASTTPTTFTLRDANNVNVTAATSYTATQSNTACSTNSCVVTWTFTTSTNPFVISAGGSYTFTLQTNDSNFATASGSASVSLSATVNGASDISYYDNSTGAGATVSLPTTAVPASITNITFAAGT